MGKEKDTIMSRLSQAGLSLEEVEAQRRLAAEKIARGYKAEIKEFSLTETEDGNLELSATAMVRRLGQAKVKMKVGIGKRGLKRSRVVYDGPGGWLGGKVAIRIIDEGLKEIEEQW